MPGSRAIGPMTPDKIYCGPCRRLGQVGDQLEATGQWIAVKKAPPGRKSGQGQKRSKWFGDKKIQYVCLDCGYHGWTQHRAAEALLREQQEWMAQYRRLEAERLKRLNGRDRA